eukprot:6177111-Pleurochrysis_carterae.AAC.3
MRRSREPTTPNPKHLSRGKLAPTPSQIKSPSPRHPVLLDSNANAVFIDAMYLSRRCTESSAPPPHTHTKRENLRKRRLRRRACSAATSPPLSSTQTPSPSPASSQAEGPCRCTRVEAACPAERAREHETTQR